LYEIDRSSIAIVWRRNTLHIDDDERGTVELDADRLWFGGNLGFHHAPLVPRLPPARRLAGQRPRRIVCNGMTRKRCAKPSEARIKSLCDGFRALKQYLGQKPRIGSAANNRPYRCSKYRHFRHDWPAKPQP
jgi:hypothetical protein